MANRIQLRRGTAAEWTSANPVLAQGEPGIESDTGKQKFGNGTSAWSALPYASKGDKGDQGSPGVADDASVATQITNPSSSTRSAINGIHADAYTVQRIDRQNISAAVLGSSNARIDYADKAET